MRLRVLAATILAVVLIASPAWAACVTIPRYDTTPGEWATTLIVASSAYDASAPTTRIDIADIEATGQVRSETEVSLFSGGWTVIDGASFWPNRRGALRVCSRPTSDLFTAALFLVHIPTGQMIMQSYPARP